MKRAERPEAVKSNLASKTLNLEAKKPKLTQKYVPLLPQKFTLEAPILSTANCLKLDPTQMRAISSVIALIKPVLIKTSRFNHLKIVKKSKSETLILLPDDEEICNQVAHFGSIISIQIPKFMPLTKVQNQNYCQVWPTKFKPNENIEFWLNYGDHISPKILEKCESFQLPTSEPSLEPNKKPLRCATQIALFSKDGKLLAEYSKPEDNLPQNPVQAFSNMKILSFIDKFSQNSEAGTYLLTDKILVLNYEPCIMSAMALLHSRIYAVVFKHKNSKFGGLVSRTKLNYSNKLNHKFHVLYPENPDSIGIRLFQKTDFLPWRAG